MPAHINDGMSFEGVVPAVPGQHEEIRFDYRVARPHLSYLYSRLQFGLPEGETNRILADVVLPHLIEVREKSQVRTWERIDINPDNFNKLWPDIIVCMAEHIVQLRRPVLQELQKKSPSASDS